MKANSVSLFKRECHSTPLFYINAPKRTNDKKDISFFILNYFFRTQISRIAQIFFRSRKNPKIRNNRKLFFNQKHKNPFEFCSSFQSPALSSVSLSLKASFSAKFTPLIASLRSFKPQKKNSENRMQSQTGLNYAKEHPVLRSAKTIGKCLKNKIGIYIIYASYGFSHCGVIPGFC